MSKYADFVKMLREGDSDEGDVNRDDILRAADIIERLEQERTVLRNNIEAAALSNLPVVHNCVTVPVWFVEYLLKQGGDV